MFYCMYYWLIAPLRGGIRDDAHRTPSFSISMQVPNRKPYELSLFCDSAGAPEFARCRIPDLTRRAIDTEHLPALQVMSEHLLTALRLTCDPSISFARPGAVWAFFDEGSPHELGLDIETISEGRWEPATAQAIFEHSIEIRELMRLYADGVDQRIPLQYRYLSLYKVLEANFRTDGMWNYAALKNHLAPHAQGFKSAGAFSDPVKYLHALRDRCAHIRTGGKGRRQTIGITHLNHEAASSVEKLLPYVTAAAAAAINARSKGKFKLSEEPVFQGMTPASKSDKS